MTIEVSQYIRQAYASALSLIRINGSAIPVFDEIAFDGVMLKDNPLGPKESAAECYIVLQAQTEGQAPVQTMCSNVINAYISVRVVTSYKTGGNKNLCEKITDQVFKAIFDGRHSTKLVFNTISVESVIFDNSNTLTEIAGESNAFSKILTFNNIVTL